MQIYLHNPPVSPEIFTHSSHCLASKILFLLFFTSLFALRLHSWHWCKGSRGVSKDGRWFHCLVKMGCLAKDFVRFLRPDAVSFLAKKIPSHQLLNMYSIFGIADHSYCSKKLISLSICQSDDPKVIFWLEKKHFVGRKTEGLILR